jgi:hypothetical protein
MASSASKGGLSGSNNEAAEEHEEEEEEEDNDDEEEDDSDLDLPDTEILEARILAQSQSQPIRTQSHIPHTQLPSTPLSKPSKSKSKPKRAPSLMIRQSLGPNLNALNTDTKKADGVSLKELKLSDGRIVTFNPLELSPGRVDDEIDEGDFDEAEKAMMKARVRDEVFKSLTEKMQKWQVR